MWRCGMESWILVDASMPYAIEYWQGVAPWAVVVGAQELQLPVDQFMLVMPVNLGWAKCLEALFPVGGVATTRVNVSRVRAWTLA